MHVEYVGGLQAQGAARADLADVGVEQVAGVLVARAGGGVVVVGLLAAELALAAAVRALGRRRLGGRGDGARGQAEMVQATDGGLAGVDVGLGLDARALLPGAALALGLWLWLLGLHGAGGGRGGLCLVLADEGELGDVVEVVVGRDGSWGHGGGRGGFRRGFYEGTEAVDSGPGGSLLAAGQCPATPFRLRARRVLRCVRYRRVMIAPETHFFLLFTFPVD